MTSPITALNHTLECLKINVQKRKRQRRNWMQRLMRDTVTHEESSHATDGDKEALERAENSSLERVLNDTAAENNPDWAASSEIEADLTGLGLRDAASRQGSANNTATCH